MINHQLTGVSQIDRQTDRQKDSWQTIDRLTVHECITVWRVIKTDKQKSNWRYSLHMFYRNILLWHQTNLYSSLPIYPNLFLGWLVQTCGALWRYSCSSNYTLVLWYVTYILYGVLPSLIHWHGGCVHFTLQSMRYWLQYIHCPHYRQAHCTGIANTYLFFLRIRVSCVMQPPQKHKLFTPCNHKVCRKPVYLTN